MSNKISLEQLKAQIRMGAFDEFVIIAKMSVKFIKDSELSVCLKLCNSPSLFPEKGDRTAEKEPLKFYDFEIPGVEFDGELYVYKAGFVQANAEFYSLQHRELVEESINGQLKKIHQEFMVKLAEVIKDVTDDEYRVMLKGCVQSYLDT